jgi:hypothetical protein
MLKKFPLGGMIGFILVTLVSGTASGALLLNLDADNLALSDGQAVVSWGSATASGTPTFRANQTPGGHAAVEFNGVDHFGTLAAGFFPASTSGDFIVAGLIKATHTGTYHNIIDDDVSNRPMVWIDPGFRYELNFGGGGGARGAGTGLDDWDVFIADSRTNQLYINSPTANASGGGAVPYFSAEVFDLFNRDGAQTFQGLVADLRVYNDAASFGNDFAGLYLDLSSKLVAVPTPATLPLLATGLLLIGSIGACRVARRDNA